VRATGRKIKLSEELWLDGPAGTPHGIGNHDRYRRAASGARAFMAMARNGAGQPGGSARGGRLERIRLSSLRVFSAW
jgi:hypothetical protein